MFSALGKQNDRRSLFMQGFRDGIPIGLGYLAVAFSLGITARNAGLTWFQGFLSSALLNASAGEYAGFLCIAENDSYLEAALMILVANARYLLMACALSQRFAPETKLGHRIGLGFYLTDEFFGITIARPGWVEPVYTYGAISFAAPCWAVGTALGVIAGDLLPASVVSALSVALYGMFLAIIIPPAKKDRVVLVLVAVSFVASFLFSVAPFLSELSGGTRTIILTVLISAAAAVLFPVKGEADDEK